jgi:site-specific DNA-methyltransferase (cytosine-N4-specific)
VSLEYRIGDVFERLAEIPDGSIDLIVTSPPFLALRSYLPADHPDKAREIGSEATPAAFIDTLLALTAEWGRVLAPHGSLCVELGDTFSGSSGDNWHKSKEVDGQWRHGNGTDSAPPRIDWRTGWPLAKSLTGIPTLYPWSLAYGRNLLTGQPSPAGQWRIRNVIVWARPNPPVGALGDKFRPATSYITVACRGAKRYFDLDAVRHEHVNGFQATGGTAMVAGQPRQAMSSGSNPAGAPPLDWHTDHHPEDGDWLWKLSTQPYAGSHYATFPMALPKRLIEAMCPLRVCTVCGRPSERITSVEYVEAPNRPLRTDDARRYGSIDGKRHNDHRATAHDTLGWTDCRCPCPLHQITACTICHTWRTGVVLDPFAGSGTTLEAAQAVGRHAIGIDFDPRNADLARSRVGMFMTVDESNKPAPPITPHNSTGNPRFRVGYVRTSGGAPDRHNYGEPAVTPHHADCDDTCQAKAIEAALGIGRNSGDAGTVSASIPCEACNGSGRVDYLDKALIGRPMLPCAECGGSGQRSPVTPEGVA